MGHDHHDHGHDHGHTHGHTPEPCAPERTSGHGHDHGHGHLRTPGNERRLAIVLGLVVVYIFVELGGGIWANSLALMADAGHMTSDAAALAITLFAVRMARRPPDRKRTYGFHRAEILAAVFNGGALIAIAVGIVYEAVVRLLSPSEIAGPVMMGIAAGGLLVNLVGLGVLHGGRDQDLNLRGAWLHVLSDALGSVGALAAGGLVWWKGWTWADPVASALIAVLVLRSSWALLDEAVHVLMEGVPAHIDVDEVRRVLCGTPGVRGVHDLHVWTITSGMVSMSGHVVADGSVEPTSLLREIAAILRTRFEIAHTTIQVEPDGFEEEGFHP